MDSLPPPPAERLAPVGELTWRNRLVTLFEMPTTAELSDPQRAGEQCMWCAAHSVELRPLEGMLGWEPRACAPCFEARAAKVKTYTEWAGHVECCRECTNGPRCAAAGPLAEAHAVAFEAARSGRLVICSRCRDQVDVRDPLIMPVRWIGMTLPVHGYVHSPKCQAPPPDKGRQYELPPIGLPAGPTPSADEGGDR
ncbi:hypothetical protein ACF1BS_04020 [Streptomyces sp. NPDC014748]|uniref:hypothetical protein n=1 Tax=Streptomyces sp. NPDC014748 TaxID=3364905 RepID=UPI003700CF93